MGRYKKEELGDRYSECKYWRYVSSKGSVVKWACVNCGAEIEVDYHKDTITNHKTCEACGHKKFNKKEVGPDLIKLYGKEK